MHPSLLLPSSFLPFSPSLVLQGVSSLLAMDMSRGSKCENCALGEERERHLMAAECVILHARAGESCAGCCSHAQGEFGGPRQVLAQQLPQSQLYQFTIFFLYCFFHLKFLQLWPHLSIPSLSLFFFPIIKAVQNKSQPLLLGQQLSIFCPTEMPCTRFCEVTYIVSFL